MSRPTVGPRAADATGCDKVVTKACAVGHEVPLRTYCCSASYNAFAGAPVSSATTFAAGRGFAPASTSRRSAATAGSRSGAPAGAAPTTSTTSPRGGGSA